MKLFRKESLAKVTSLENLDKLLTVVGIKGWVILLFFALLFVAVVFWAFLGKIPITASGKAILLDPQHSYVIRSQTEGTVKEVRKIGGQFVQKGEVIVTLVNDLLSKKVHDRKEHILHLEQEVMADAAADGFASGNSSKRRELLLMKEELSDLKKMEDSLLVRAPHTGKLIWVDLNEGDLVVPNEILATMQGNLSLETVKIFAFIPLGPGQLIKPGMSAKCALNLYSSQKYGMVLGKVQQVMPYPISPDEYYMQKIPSMPLKNYLIGNDLSNVLIIIDPILDSSTYSGLAWTSGDGPQAHIEPSILGTARVTLEEVKPISYVLPLFGK